MGRAETGRELTWAYVALLLLLIGAMGVPYLALGAWSPLASYTIAFLKAGVIAFAFMEVARGSRLYIVAFVSGLLWLFLLIFITALDVLYRPPIAY